jgi:hypothetical protein
MQSNVRTYDQKTCADHNRLHLDVQIHGESNSEVVGISERLSQQPRPLFRDLSHLRTAILRKNLQSKCIRYK